jgi:hypothetical protein
VFLGFLLLQERQALAQHRLLELGILQGSLLPRRLEQLAGPRINELRVYLQCLDLSVASGTKFGHCYHILGQSLTCVCRTPPNALVVGVIEINLLYWDFLHLLVADPGVPV